jgi:hypothetical protein
MTSYTYIFSPGKRKQSLYRQHQQLADCALFSSQTDQQKQQIAAHFAKQQKMLVRNFFTPNVRKIPHRETQVSACSDFAST